MGAILALFPVLAGQEATVEVYDLRSYTHPTHTRIVIDIGKLREFSSADLKDPDRFYVDVYQARLNPILHGKVIVTNCDYLKEIRIGQKNETTVRVVVEVNPAEVERYQVFPLFDPFRIVLDIFPESVAGRAAGRDRPSPAPQPPEPTRAATAWPASSAWASGRWSSTPATAARTPAPSGARASRKRKWSWPSPSVLRDLLVAKGLDVILTRESDIFIPLENRTVIANQKAADIFVSIHANANRKRERRGVQTFYLNFSPDPQVVEIAARENATSTRTMGQMKSTLGKIVQNSKILESRDLADKIQGNLVRSLSRHYSAVGNLGVRGGPFWVLIGGEMPSVLVEISPSQQRRGRGQAAQPGVPEAGRPGHLRRHPRIHEIARKRITDMDRRDFIKDVAVGGLLLRLSPSLLAQAQSRPRHGHHHRRVAGGDHQGGDGGDRRHRPVHRQGRQGHDQAQHRLGPDARARACTNPEVVKTLVELCFRSRGQGSHGHGQHDQPGPALLRPLGDRRRRPRRPAPTCRSSTPTAQEDGPQGRMAQGLGGHPRTSSRSTSSSTSRSPSTTASAA